jgi:hypothetical protein
MPLSLYYCFLYFNIRLLKRVKGTNRLLSLPLILIGFNLISLSVSKSLLFNFKVNKLFFTSR